MTNRGKIFLTILVLGMLAFGAYRFRDQIVPPTKMANSPSVNPDEFKKSTAPTAPPAAPAPSSDINSKLLAGDKAATLVSESTIPPVAGTSDYDKPLKNGKLVVQFPINVWPGWAPIVMANHGMEANDQSVFFQKYGFYVQLSIVDDPVKARDLFASGHSHVLWGTLDMMALFAPELIKDSRTAPVICQQVDWSGGGDGIVVRGDIKSMNDFRATNGKRRKVVLAQNSPSHYLIMTLLLEAGIDPANVDFRWAADAPAAAKIFVQDKSFDAFVGWSPDIYNVTDLVPGTRLVVSTASANHLVADVWAVRNDFYRDHPDIVANLVRGIFEGTDMVRKDVDGAAKLMSKAFNLPMADCQAMIGKDGGIATGDAHLANYRENANFFLDPMNPSSFEIVWNRASSIYKSLGAIDTMVSPAKVKEAKLLAKMSEEYKDVADLSQPTFKPGALYKNAEATTAEILTKAIIITFEPNASTLNSSYDTNIPALMEEVGRMAGGFGNAYIVIEGNTDASRKGVVPSDLVRQLSYDRAASVKKALLEKFKFNPDKFKVIGNGWDNPLPGMNDSSNSDNNKKNRRVEIKVFRLEE